MAGLELVEVAPRDGIQNEPVHLDIDTRQTLVRKAVEAGMRRVECASFVNPKRVPQMAGAAELIAALRDDPVTGAGGTQLAALALNLRGAIAAIEAGVEEVNFVVVATESFNQRNQGASVENTLAQWREVRNALSQSGTRATLTIGAAFGCPFEGEVPSERFGQIIDLVGDALPDELALADTIGVAAPSDVAERFGLIHEALPGMPLRAHFHNTRNTGLANAAAAIAAGVEALDASLGGFGGCPFAPAATGNIPTEDLAYMLQRMGYAKDLDLQRLIAAAAWLGEALEASPPAMLGRAGIFPDQPA